ncbi:hypothetical protein BDZ89DRAFT_975920 [Hymenopellis radicata]|nr:hypothetical protein BDZ89DRAFT_975920 [Hymenopellis radicata]
MSDRVLQYVLQDIRPYIIPKLTAELADEQSNNEKKGSVETHRGDSYQFCYFLRKSQPHSVLTKTRTYTTAANPPIPKSQKRKTNDSSAQPRKRPKNKGKGKAIETDEASGEEDDDNTRRSTRRGNDDDDAYSPGADWNMAPPDLEDEKPKPIMQIKYRGFDIIGHCLCMVVEPWPPLRAPSTVLMPSRERSKTPAVNAAMLPPPVPEMNVLRRERTPLFLPDDEDRERSQTPFSFTPTSERPPVAQQETENDDGWGMMEFSQVLHSAGDTRAGPLDDDDDMEGAVFFGDADEVKEL